MPFFVYATILIVAVFSVGLEWHTLVEPSGATLRDMRTVSELGKPASGAEPNLTLKPATPASAAAQAKAEPPPAAAVDDALAQKAAAPAPKCNVEACRAAYFTFNPADCTYQPTDGPRRLCTRGLTAAAAGPAAAAAPTAPGCHYRSCAEHYSSFNPSDCTYQPLEGPRRLCEK